jgi:hypothetical protein
VFILIIEEKRLAMSYLNVFCRHLSKQFYTKRITQTSSVDQALDEMTNLDNYFDFPSGPHDRTCRGWTICNLSLIDSFDFFSVLGYLASWGLLLWFPWLGNRGLVLAGALRKRNNYLSFEFNNFEQLPSWTSFVDHLDISCGPIRTKQQRPIWTTICN